MKKTIKKVVILGGGTAGWMSAAFLKKMLPEGTAVTLVESEAIGTVGVGEATIPPIQAFNNKLGIDERQFIQETKATMKLAIKFENWKKQGQSYFHTFGAPGRDTTFCQFHHYLARAKKQGLVDPSEDIWHYDLNAMSAEAGKFAKINSERPMLKLPYAYHFDAGLYAAFLRKFSENLGVKRIEGKVNKVTQCQLSGDVESLILESGESISGDLFIDCSGLAALLIEKTLGAGFDDWSKYLPCNSAVAVASERLDVTLPYTRSIAHSSGWQWRIPLQHRNGNGLVYSDSHYSDEQALDLLMSNLDTKAVSDPKTFKFTTGRRLKPWYKNVVAIGLSAGFLEPLESTSIHFIQSGLSRLLHLFPNGEIFPALSEKYNQLTELEYTQVRDFLVLHYHQNERTDSDFWLDLQHMELPERLVNKLSLFKEQGLIFRDQNDLFLEASWLQVMVGQGLSAQEYHCLADSMPEAQLLNMLRRIKDVKQTALSQLPSHDQYIINTLNAAKRA
ncbi:tryptophan 7-halogenase [Thalassotalea sp. LPB0316]|uniref:tryptophan halogenase family protein n=1 Tax=Thalassotalea sp. LPB0316 TaxID=2769490 RepID=UPI001865AE3A|nr:tryptophan halogenase family protein [Thalassotalea sp. LPB0316]QOL26244.1 tryptophan 7-halogenase [Thalassotalea sp. LPB0316]